MRRAPNKRDYRQDARKTIVPLTPDQQALAAGCVRLAWKEAWRAVRLFAIDEDEATSLALYALSHAAGLFDPTRGIRFTTYATRAIRNEFSKHKQYWSHACRAGIPWSIEDADGTIAVAESGAGVPELAHAADMRRRLREALKRLPPREWEVVWRRANGETLEAIGGDLGVTRQGVCDIEERGTARLASMLGEPRWLAALAARRRKRTEAEARQRREARMAG